MDYYNNIDNVLNYITMCEDYDSSELIEILRSYLPKSSSLLEQGMGPGKDLDILKKDYNVVGLDYSKLFIQIKYFTILNTTTF